MRRTDPVDPHDVQWVVNDSYELGVKIGNQFFWLYKGETLIYTDGKHDDGTPMRWRLVGKREFGETCNPFMFILKNEPMAGSYEHHPRGNLVELDGTPTTNPKYQWQDLPPALGELI